MKQKILLMIEDLEIGGAERQLVKLVQKIPQDRYDVTVCCISRRGLWADELQNNNIRVVCFDKRAGFDPSILLRLTAFIRSERPDIINTYLWTADLWGRVAAILAGAKHVVVTEQNVDLWKRWYHKAIDRILFKWTDYAICVSEEVVKFYHDELKLPLAKLKMIPNAIDVALFDHELNRTEERKKLGLSNDEFVFVCAARLHPQKAHDVLIDAVAKIVDAGRSGFRVLLVGEGELREKLERQIESMGLSSVISLFGLRHDIPDILLISDAFVLSSDYEGLSLAVLEAMAARLPVVATAVGGNPQIIEDAVTGYLVPAQNPGKLALAMETIMENGAKTHEMGVAGRKRIEKEYEIGNIADQTLNLFESLLQT